jgi:protein required for attachment to host cells
MPTKPKKTWIVIADGMHARILRQDKHGGPLTPALDRELYQPAVHGFSRDLHSDAPGRAFDSVSGGRHAMEPRTDPKVHEKHLFARRVAELLNEAALRKEFDQLVLAAPPKTLGDLRAELSDAVKERVVREIDRDLVKTPMHELRDHLPEVLA